VHNKDKAVRENDRVRHDTTLHSKCHGYVNLWHGRNLSPLRVCVASVESNAALVCIEVDLAAATYHDSCGEPVSDSQRKL
jgi:hypothetical protein